MSGEHLDADQVRTLLREHIRHRYGSQAEAGRIWGLSAAFVNMVLLGHKLPNDVMLAEVGLERIVTYRKARP